MSGGASSEPGAGSSGKGGGTGPVGNIDFLLREVREGRSGEVEVPGQNLGRRMAEPVCDREGPELREIAVVEHQNESAGAGTEALDRMAVAAREIPNIARTEIGDLGPVFRVDRGDAAASFDDIGPFCCVGVPVKLAKRTGLERHIDAGKLVRNGKPGDVRLLGRAAIEGLGLHAAERIAEGGELGLAERRGRRSVTWLGGLAPRSLSAPQQATHRHSSHQIASRQPRHVFLVT